MEVLEGNYFGASEDRLIQRLGEALHGWKRGPMKTLNGLARAGLSVLDGVVLTDEAHEAFLKASGLLEDLRVPPWKRKIIYRKPAKYAYVTARGL